MRYMYVGEGMETNVVTSLLVGILNGRLALSIGYTAQYAPTLEMLFQTKYDY